MQKLKDANLYRSELIPISGKLVERYNKCLESLGFKPTTLKTFSIDAIGWSPEIAEEKGDRQYLNHGDANPHGIIISPLQKNKPVHEPYHTFDREMMQYVFKTYEAKIKDITRSSAISIDFDQGIDAFYDPLDILKYERIAISFRLIGDLDKIQKKQLKLIETFNKDNNFIDENLHEQLLKSAKKYGDLRHRTLSLDTIYYETDSFFTKAFNGVYVLRDFITPILVFEDEHWYKEAIKDTTYDVLMYHISHPELMTKLRDHMIVEVNLEAEVKTDRYERIKMFMFHEYIKENEHPIRDILTDNVLFRRYLNKVDVKTLKKINGVEIYLERLERSNAFKIQDLVEESFYFALHRPHSSLTVKHQDLLWRLLVNVSPKDVLFLYWYDKEEFYTRYNTWNDSLKEWVIEIIRNNI